MADRSSPDANADDALAIMNEHLARFFEHADGLLAEWQAYGESLRANLDAQARELEQTVALAVERAGRDAAAAVDAHLEQAVRASLDRLRSELDGLTDKAHGGRQGAVRARADTHDPARQVAVHHDVPIRQRGWYSGVVLLGLTLANVLLAALLVTSFRSCRGSVLPGHGSEAARPADAGVAVDSGASKAGAVITPTLAPDAGAGADVDAGPGGAGADAAKSDVPKSGSPKSGSPKPGSPKSGSQKSGKSKDDKAAPKDDKAAPK